MNKIQLADELEYACGIAEPRITMMKRMKQAAAMLRHQSNQIEALKTQLAYLESKVYGGTTK
jgi:hypothetical protein